MKFRELGKTGIKLSAIDIELTNNERDRLNKISENWNNMGDRYPANLEALTNK